jgi:exopolysaccharide biosynthesis predicted pyruvyltransferase EpsI
MDDVIAFLGSAETVVTNSYHGAYWATLLGRRVVVVDPFSTKFFFLKHRPVIAALQDYTKAISRTRIYPESLSECREANLNFSVKVKNLLSARGALEVQQ